MHTPGPWKVIDRPHGLPEVWTADFDCEGGTVSQCITDRVFNGNAALIAAAPDLLAACNLALATIDRVAPSHPGGFSSVRGTLDVIRAAVAKAEGRAHAHP